MNVIYALPVSMCNFVITQLKFKLCSPFPPLFYLCFSLLQLD